jgi:hypothetical protein
MKSSFGLRSAVFAASVLASGAALASSQHVRDSGPLGGAVKNVLHDATRAAPQQPAASRRPAPNPAPNLLTRKPPGDDYPPGPNRG